MKWDLKRAIAMQELAQSLCWIQKGSQVVDTARCPAHCCLCAAVPRPAHPILWTGLPLFAQDCYGCPGLRKEDVEISTVREGAVLCMRISTRSVRSSCGLIAEPTSPITRPHPRCSSLWIPRRYWMIQITFVQREWSRSLGLRSL